MCEDEVEEAETYATPEGSSDGVGVSVRRGRRGRGRREQKKKEPNEFDQV